MVKAGGVTPHSFEDGSTLCSLALVSKKLTRIVATHLYAKITLDLTPTYNESESNMKTSHSDPTKDAKRRDNVLIHTLSSRGEHLRKHVRHLKVSNDIEYLQHYRCLPAVHTGFVDSLSIEHELQDQRLIQILDHLSGLTYLDAKNHGRLVAQECLLRTLAVDSRKCHWWASLCSPSVDVGVS